MENRKIKKSFIWTALSVSPPPGAATGWEGKEGPPPAYTSTLMNAGNAGCASTMVCFGNDPDRRGPATHTSVPVYRGAIEQSLRWIGCVLFCRVLFFQKPHQRAIPGPTVTHADMEDQSMWRSLLMRCQKDVVGKKNTLSKRTQHVASIEAL